VIVAAKPRHALSSLTRPQGVVGAVSGLAPEIERKLTSMEGALGRGRGGPSRAFVRSGLGSVGRLSTSLERSGRLTANRQGRQRLGWAGCTGQKTPRISTAPIRLSPLSRR